MTCDDEHCESSNRLGSIPLASMSLRAPIEDLISKSMRREWRISSARDMSEFACHPCAILSDGAFAVFVKYSKAPEGAQQFEVEMVGLRYLAENAGVMVPTPIAVVPVENGTLLVMEALQAIARTPLQWRQIGRTLARIHRVKSDYFGFQTNGFAGPLYQDNTPAQDWVTYYRDRFLRPRLRMAIDSGNLTSSVARQVEKLVQRLPELCGPEVTPSLLHGDAQQNNFISTAKGAFVIDPAIYYGNPEIDLALVDSFQPVPDDVLDGYREEMPIAPGFFERRALWRVPLYLAAVTLEGPIHLSRLNHALQVYA